MDDTQPKPTHTEPPGPGSDVPPDREGQPNGQDELRDALLELSEKVGRRVADRRTPNSPEAT